MIRVMVRKITILSLLSLLILPAATAAAGSREGPSSKEVKQMIEFGISLGEQGLWKEALYRWREALRYDPDNPKLLNNIAVALESQGNLEEARQAYMRARELAGRARYIERNIEDFEELFTALEQYEAQYRKPPTGTGEGPNDGAAADGVPKADGMAGDGCAPAEDAAGTEGEAAETDDAAIADEAGPGPDAPTGDQPVEETE